MTFQFDESYSYLNSRTGQVFVISQEEIDAAQENQPLGDFPQWQQDNLKTARQIVCNENPDFISLPDRFDIDEYHMMECFISSVTNETARQELFNSIKGKGSFRRFKLTLDNIGLLTQWYHYKDAAYKDAAIQWCKDHDISYIDK